MLVCIVLTFSVLWHVQLNRVADQDEIVDMEEKFCSVSLDIIGRAVFNYEFNSVTAESPVVRVRRESYLPDAGLFLS